MICIQKGNEKVVEWLIKAGADVNATDYGNWTPLHYAVKVFSGSKIVEMLIKNGANVNAQDKQQNTPLHEVISIDTASDKQYAIAEILLNNGADISLKNAQDKTPLDLAQNEKSKSMIAVFSKSFHLINFFHFFCS